MVTAAISELKEKKGLSLLDIRVQQLQGGLHKARAVHPQVLEDHHDQRITVADQWYKRHGPLQISSCSKKEGTANRPSPRNRVPLLARRRSLQLRNQPKSRPPVLQKEEVAREERFPCCQKAKSGCCQAKEIAS